MGGMTGRLPDFEAMYTANPDPWEVGSSWYERRKIAVVLSCLRRERYRLGWEAACGTGHLVDRLADRCGQVVATDACQRAVALTTARTAGRPHVHCAVSALPAHPEGLGVPDLIVLSEVLYYLDEPTREETYQLIDTVAAPDADVVGVHWRPLGEDYTLPGAQAHRDLGEALTRRGWTRVVTHTDEEFLVGVWSRALPEQIGR
ncbi:hypothetical protein KEM60_00229 [Austwickia sp. TVS 96-490-7B]|uniref:SAM-dependent methyltransferase n=1 Tax=Austwickia sp. TVS 96-490-7B TaxID=2830843 RepID=UPI001C59FFCC|nr:SAM-dependent methyltransferase [Austwickia sp. TVS 96-490-7B]MBW3084046.1 hypothetical protein [Austwickia sp. TVS 96-490-7B]